jgi:L-asparaginase II
MDIRAPRVRGRTAATGRHLNPGAPLVDVVRDDAIEAVHTGHVVVVGPDGTLVVAHGDPDVVIYPRSVLKPFQAAAVLGMVALRPPSDERAVMAASHVGGVAQQAAVTRLLDRAGVSVTDLRCPEALPVAPEVLRREPVPTRLAHNCSGKHAGMLLATMMCDADPTSYLSPSAPVQVAVRGVLADVSGTDPVGPGVDGCGAPAWRLPVVAVARAFARLAAACEPGELWSVGEAMRTHPELVGGHGVVDTELMRAERRLVAKRGAEGALGIAARTAAGPLGIIVKVADGGPRALGPVAVAIVERLGLRGPDALRRPVVLGGGEVHGGVSPAPALARTLQALA